MTADADVRLVSNSPTVRKAVKEGIAPLKATARGCGPRNVPHRADAVVTTSALNSSVERLAARLGTCWIFVLPEALAALQDFIESSPAAQGERRLLVGADVASLDRLAKADMDVNRQQEVLL